MEKAKNAIAALTSRRNFMKNAVAAVAASALPVAAIASSPPPTSPMVRMSGLVKELQEVAKLRYPNLRADWTVKFADPDDDLGCKILIAAFEDDASRRQSKRRVRTA